jgi:radical SAM-linked protein
VFEKGFVLRHIGHLDLMRTVQRALRRSNLPIRYSQGFNPHIQLSFASPLSVGVVGMREIMDVPIEGEMDTVAFAEELNSALPDCLRVKSARAVPDDFPALMALVAGSRLRVEIDGCPEADRVAEAFPGFMKTDECVTLRKTKSGENQTNIRPFVTEATLEKTDAGYTLRCVIANRREGSLKPAVLMRALCATAEVEQVPFIAYRDAILAKNRDGRLVSLEDYAYV